MFEGTSCINDPIIISPDLAFRAEATTGEGSIWHPDRNTLFWVDIEGKTLYEYIPDLQNCRSWQFDRMVSTVVPETDSTVVVALQNEIIRVNLTDGRFDQLIDELKKRYDYIILDNVPALVVADAAIVSRVTDLTIYVIRDGVLDRRYLPELERLHQDGKFKNMCIVLNDSQVEKKKYGYGYGQGYGYGYGYGHISGYYSEENKDKK